VSDAPLFNTVRDILVERTGKGLTNSDVQRINQALGKAEPAVTQLSLRGYQELVCHEAIVQEAYKDSKGIWTWGIGVTNASGHIVNRYRDKPQPLDKCIEIFVWLVKERYLKDVLEAFKGFDLTEAQLAAAVSFHYNTGSIKSASWVALWKQKKYADARVSFASWRIPAEIVGRRNKEIALFFDGIWSNDGKTTVIPVRKPSYQPNFAQAKRVDISEDLKKALRL
jgi:lysozyme